MALITAASILKGYGNDLKCGDPSRRLTAIYPLSTYGNESNIEDLIFALNDEEIGVRFYAIRGIERLMVKQAIPNLISRLHNKTETKNIKNIIIDTLYKFYKNASEDERMLIDNALSIIDKKSFEGKYSLLEKEFDEKLSSSINAIAQEIKKIHKYNRKTKFVAYVSMALAGVSLLFLMGTGIYFNSRRKETTKEHTEIKKKISSFLDEKTNKIDDAIKELENYKKIYKKEVEGYLPKYIEGIEEKIGLLNSEIKECKKEADVQIKNKEYMLRREIEKIKEMTEEINVSIEEIKSKKKKI